MPSLVSIQAGHSLTKSKLYNPVSTIPHVYLGLLELIVLSMLWLFHST